MPAWSDRDMTKFRAATIRAARTFAQVFIAVIFQQWTTGNEGVSISGLWGVVEVRSDAAAGTALVAALLALGLNMKRPGPTPLAS